MYKQKSFKATLSFLILAILAILVAYYFLLRDIRLKNERASTLSQEVSLLSNKQDYLVSTQKMIEGLSKDIARIDNSIIAKDGDVAFIENLESLAKNNGLTINIDSLVVENDPILSGAGLTLLKIKAKTSGNWSGTYTFLSQIESLSFKVKVNRFSVVSNSMSLLEEGKVPVSPVWSSLFEIVVLKYR